MYRDLKYLKKDQMYLKGERVYFEEMKKLKLGTLLVGRNSNKIYNVIGRQKLFNRRDREIFPMNDVAVHKFLGYDLLKESVEF